MQERNTYMPQAYAFAIKRSVKRLSIVVGNVAASDSLVNRVSFIVNVDVAFLSQQWRKILNFGVSHESNYKHVGRVPARDRKNYFS